MSNNEAKAPRPGMEFWDKICSLKHYGFIHSPDNSRVLKCEGIGNWIDKYEAQEIVDQAQSEINALRKELASVKENGRHWFESSNKAIDAMTLVANQRDALQLRLNAADQRNDEHQEERQKLIAYGRSLGLEEASTVCSRMAYETYYPAGSRFKYFTPKAQKCLGDILIKAANAIAGLPGGPYDRFKARQQKKAGTSAVA